MSQLSLHRLAGHLLLNTQARHAMLSGDRDAVLRQFDLTSEEKRELSQARVNSLPNLLATIEGLIQSPTVGDLPAPAPDDGFLLKPRQLACR